MVSGHQLGEIFAGIFTISWGGKMKGGVAYLIVEIWFSRAHMCARSITSWNIGEPWRWIEYEFVSQRTKVFTLTNSSIVSHWYGCNLSCIDIWQATMSSLQRVVCVIKKGPTRPGGTSGPSWSAIGSSGAGLTDCSEIDNIIAMSSRCTSSSLDNLLPEVGVVSRKVRWELSDIEKWNWLRVQENNELEVRGSKRLRNGKKSCCVLYSVMVAAQLRHLKYFILCSEVLEKRCHCLNVSDRIYKGFIVAPGLTRNRYWNTYRGWKNQMQNLSWSSWAGPFRRVDLTWQSEELYKVIHAQ